MIDDSHENALRIERATHFDNGVISKVFRLVNVLEGIFSPEWKDVLALKGGTAVNLFYTNLPRLSIDIDLDFIVTSKEEMLSKRSSLRLF